jgi:hypothetical protein
MNKLTTETRRYIDGGLVGCDASWTCKLVPMFQRKVLPPSSRRHNPGNNHRHFHRCENLDPYKEVRNES